MGYPLCRRGSAKVAPDNLIDTLDLSLGKLIILAHMTFSYDFCTPVADVGPDWKLCFLRRHFHVPDCAPDITHF